MWKNNELCPECGKPADHTIRCCEFGYSYCSHECARIFVNREWRKSLQHQPQPFQNTKLQEAGARLKKLIADTIYKAEWVIEGRLWPCRNITEFYMVDENERVESIINSVRSLKQ